MHTILHPGLRPTPRHTTHTKSYTWRWSKSVSPSCTACAYDDPGAALFGSCVQIPAADEWNQY